MHNRSEDQNTRSLIFPNVISKSLVSKYISWKVPHDRTALIYGGVLSNTQKVRGHEG